jgi:hypothetical protein
MEQSVWVMCCGDLGRRVAEHYQQASMEVVGWARTDQELLKGQAQGLSLRQGKFDSSCYTPFYCRENVRLFWFAPPPARGDEDIRLRRFLLAAGEALQRLVLLVRVGCDANSARGKRYRDAQIAAQEWAQQYHRDLVIVRIPDCYAPYPPEQLAAVCQQAMEHAAAGAILDVSV